MFIAFSALLRDFLSSGNILTLLRNVSVLGMLGLGMSTVVIGRGIDLSMVATLVIGMSWALKMTSLGVSFNLSLIVGSSFALVAGLIVGVVIAYAEIPAVFCNPGNGTGHLRIRKCRSIF